jgi:hypothetical protein
MKRIFIFLLCQGSLEGNAQDMCPCPTSDNHIGVIVYNSPTIDTVHANLLITLGPMQTAFHYKGYIVGDGHKPITFLNKHLKPFKPSVVVWAYQQTYCIAWKGDSTYHESMLLEFEKPGHYKAPVKVLGVIE